MMKLSDVARELDLRVCCGRERMDGEVRGGYCCDLLSNVMGGCGQGYVWITIQTHQNILGVASLLDLSGIIIAEGFEPDEDTRERADEKGIPILVSDSQAFDLCGRLFELGLRGRDNA